VSFWRATGVAVGPAPVVGASGSREVVSMRASVMSSTPYVPVGSSQAESPYTYYDDDDPHGQGLVTFAGVMLMIAAVLNTIYGIAAIDKANVFVQHARYVFR
jgi:hypothetical protein